ncbi:secreted protein [Melampsora americana]|nr:secreted protein [Melampsora americana]
MRSFAILLFAMMALFQSHLVASSTLTARADQHVGQQSANEAKEIQQKILGWGLPYNVISPYASRFGYPWGTCGGIWTLGCGSYVPTCLNAWSCSNYNLAVNSLAPAFQRLVYLRKMELKGQVDHKEDENQA